MTTYNTQQLTIVAEYVLRRLHRLAEQADREAKAVESSIGFVGTSTDAAVSGGTHSSVVERTAAGRDLATVRQWMQAKERLARALGEVDQALTLLLPANQAEWQPPGSGDCGACHRWVAGTATDRLRSGLCDACRTWVRRVQAEQHLERGDAITARRRMLSSEAEAAS
jgi:type IV secretory pathway TrbL component